MKHIKIGIVEDEGITTELIIRSLRKLNYKIAEPASCYSEAIEMIQKEKPDLLLIDINLNDERDGINLANYIKDNVGTPFIFLTANGDSATINRAKSSRPLAFLIKPFTQVDLHAAIETALNLEQSRSQNAKEKVGYLFFKVGAEVEKFMMEDILFFENNARNFDVNFIDGRVVTIRITASELLSKLPVDSFVQIQRSFIINIKHVTKIDNNSVHLGVHQLAFKRAFKDTLLDKLMQ